MIRRAARSSRGCCNIIFNSSFVCVKSLIGSYLRVSALKLRSDDDDDDDDDDDNLFLWDG